VRVLGGLAQIDDPPIGDRLLAGRADVLLACEWNGDALGAMTKPASASQVVTGSTLDG
jgi:hypothetical protein